MKKLIILILFCSCSNAFKKEKPFIIYSKGEADNGSCMYYYQDKSGYSDQFYENSNKYNVGDTIK